MSSRSDRIRQQIPPSRPPAREDLERLALFDPAVNAALAAVRHGDVTFEQALIGLVYELTVTKIDMIDRAVGADSPGYYYQFMPSPVSQTGDEPPHQP